MPGNKTKPRKPHQEKRKGAPVMVFAATRTQVEMRQRQAVEAFRGGWAQPHHFDDLVEARDVLLIAANEKDQKDVVRVCNITGDALYDIKARYMETQALGAIEDEVPSIAALVEVSLDFWSRQSMALYDAACRTASKVYRERKAEREALAA